MFSRLGKKELFGICRLQERLKITITFGTLIKEFLISILAAQKSSL